MPEKIRTAAEFRESLLAVVVGHGALMFEPETADGLPLHLNIHTTVYAYMAHRFLAALEEHASPQAVTKLLADVQEALDCGELPMFAWDDAVAAGLDPSPWGDKTVEWARKVNARAQEAAPDLERMRGELGAAADMLARCADVLSDVHNEDAADAAQAHAERIRAALAAKAKP